ncbi:MAG: hypothetical protein KAU21_03160 [Gammaproteobacteria bacterium]|nr:hypothetical protein [Gammaproteobacteria bacterium]
MKKKYEKFQFSVLERAKVDEKTADFISKEALKLACSRSQVIRNALEHYMSYEESKVLTEITALRELTEELNNRLLAMGEYEQSRFDQLLRAVKAHRKNG